MISYIEQEKSQFDFSSFVNIDIPLTICVGFIWVKKIFWHNLHAHFSLKIYKSLPWKKGTCLGPTASIFLSTYTYESIKAIRNIIMILYLHYEAQIPELLWNRVT